MVEEKVCPSETKVVIEEVKITD